MDINELAVIEIELYFKVILLEGTLEAKVKQIHQLGIFDTYKEIFNQYSLLSKINSEALKRGFFLLWYSKLEPPYYTGIGELDKDCEEKIIRILNKRVKNNIADYELDWMISYYSNWDYLFDDFNQYAEFQNKLKNKLELPSKIDPLEMGLRGQVGALLEFNN